MDSFENIRQESWMVESALDDSNGTWNLVSESPLDSSFF